VLCSPYGVGKRIDLPSTRNIIHNILNGNAEKYPLEDHPIFNVKFPTHIDGVNPALLNPRKTWKSPEAYDEAAKKLAGMFIKNFQQFKAGAKVDYSIYGPKL
jgi:phosphoenolpyruvate carboxykinase (ATP)